MNADFEGHEAEGHDENYTRRGVDGVRQAAEVDVDDLECRIRAGLDEVFGALAHDPYRQGQFTKLLVRAMHPATSTVIRDWLTSCAWVDPRDLPELHGPAA